MADLNGPPTPDLGPDELGVLEACAEAAGRRRELLPALAEAVGVPPDQVFYTWMLRRDWLLGRAGQHGRVGDTGWAYCFHGYECDLAHDDGRLVRFDFGPGGRVDTFTSWGVLQYILTSGPPWSEFLGLKARLGREGRASAGRRVADTRPMDIVWGALVARGAFEPAAPDLVALQARYTTVGPDGLTYVRFPPGTPDATQADCAVAHRQTLSAVGRRLLQAHAVGTAG
jgi:hypothetical protein